MGKFDGWLIATDFDETIRPHRGLTPVSAENLAAAERFMAEGGLFTLATGRDPRSYLFIRHLVPVNAPAILSNGAVLFDGETGESLYEGFLPFTVREDMKKAIEAFPGTGMEIHRGVHVCGAPLNDAVREHMRHMGEEPVEADRRRVLYPWTKVAMIVDAPLHEENETAHALAAWIMDTFPGRYEAVPSGAIVDVAAAGHDKGTGVRRLAEMLDIDPEKVVCAGDSWNDLPMLRSAARAFAPSNAIEAVRTEPGVTVVGPSEVCLRDIVEILEREAGPA